MKTMICIVCPKGCHLSIDPVADRVTGHACPRGAVYAHKELTDPRRTLTSTVCVTGAPIQRLPVKTDAEIPKDLLLPAARLLDGLTVEAPVKLGDMILANVLGTGANIIATRSLPKK